MNFDSIFTSIGEFLIVDEEPVQADVIIVLGGFSRLTLDRGAELYRAGYADKILLSGGGERWDMLVSYEGIPEDAILIEDKSATTFENAKFSYRIVQDQGFESVIVVATVFHTYRCSKIFNQVFKDVDVTICPVSYDAAVTQEWWKDKYSSLFVISEYFKLTWHYLFEWN